MINFFLILNFILTQRSLKIQFLLMEILALFKLFQLLVAYYFYFQLILNC